MDDCLLWEGSHAGAGEERKESTLVLILVKEFRTSC